MKRMDANGQDLVEYALVLPLLLTVMVGIAELSLIGFRYVNVASAAREGARRGIVVVGADVVVVSTTVVGAADLSEVATSA